MKTAKKVKIGLGIALIVMLAAFFHYNLPRTAVVQITGTDMKRVDTTQTAIKKQDDKTNPVQTKQYSSDVRFINSVSRDGKIKVFRNEDTGWGWPPYLKFNSADITAQAQVFATAPDKQWILVKFYGWRSTVFSMFPNVIKLKAVDKDYTHFPLFNISFFFLLFVLIFIIRKKTKQFLSWIFDRSKAEK